MTFLLCLILSVRVTVYNSNLGLIKDTRTFNFEKGKQKIEFKDVASSIDPTSVSFKASHIEILEQNYEYDLVSPVKLFKKYIDHKITLFMKEGKIEEGILLSFNDKNITLKSRDGIKIIERDEIIHTNLPKLPEGLITRPTLMWWVYSKSSGKKECEVSYLTENINWHAEYTGILKDSELDFSGWVSVNNRSGATYPDAKLKLVAGKPHRIEKPRPRFMREAKIEAAALAVPRFEERAFFEYHIYDLKEPTTIKDNEEKQIRFIPSTQVKIKKVYVYDGRKRAKSVEVRLEFKNSEESGLGIPLPEGKVRVYKEDTDGSLEFAGEDKISHTPKDELVSLWLGDAFDLVGERKIMKDSKITDRVREQEIEISLRNHKSSKVKIKVIEHLFGDWEILKYSYPFEKKDAYTIEFNPEIAANSEEKVKYKVRISW
ncbi:DUF4139 domain-containing protein [candidate division WOR-3 bacterium]|nr:DUF4139 domain-containing protein [candidate division WOR-3 bacterium]